MKEINSRVNAEQADELSEGKLILVHSIEAVSLKLKEYFEKDIRGKMKSARDIIAHEFSETPKDLAFILLATIVRSISKEAQVPSVTLIKQLIKAIYDSILVRRLDRDDTTFSAFVDKRFKKRSAKFRELEKIKIVRRQMQMNEQDLVPVTTYLGAVLLDLVVKSGINIIESRIIYSKGKKMQYIVYTEECFRMVLESRERLLNDYRKYPIHIVPPKDWSAFSGSGGYQNEDLYKLPLIKCRIGSKKYLQAFFKSMDVSKVYETVNIMQKTAWRINNEVFSVMDYIFQNNLIDPDSADNNPYLLGKLPYNGQLEPEDFINIHNYGEINEEGNYKGLPKEKAMMRKYFKDLEEQRDITISNTGKSIMLNLVLFNAKEYLEEDEFFFSYQYDFRGRIYPIQQHLQPQGKGEVKALLEFAEGCKIETQEQLEWFLIHGANCYGYDKDLYVDRISQIKEHEADIKLVAEDPIRNRLLWKDADEPFLYLAWCLEYAEYLRDPDGFRSHIPIALDATCSGIQIYSGLLKDKEGAEAVNVIGQTRNDIYQRVADKVNLYLKSGDYIKEFTYSTSDNKAHSVSTIPTADSLKGNITRKLTKRNTMTQPYSVTKYGMYEQIKDELQALENNGKKFWVGDLWVAAKLITDLNDRAIADLVKGARAGQGYLKAVTGDLVKKGNWVFYTVPSTNFPVLQKLHKTRMDRVVTPIGKLSIRTTLSGINAQKMVSGIAPNYIHSLDASLLASTVLKLKEDGCSSFHLIHDSYGVPVNQVVNLNKRVREAFVEMFEKNPLARWVAQVNPDFEVKPEEIMIDTLELTQVLESAYIFS